MNNQHNESLRIQDEAINESVKQQAEFWRTHERDIARPSFDDTHDMSKVVVLEFDYDKNDYPEYCDSYVMRAEYDGIELTEQELDELNEMRDWVYDKLMDYLF